MWWINTVIIKLRVSCWTAYILQDDTRSLQYQLLGSLPANSTHRQKRKEGLQTLTCYRLQRSVQCCSWLSGIIFMNLGRQKEAPFLFRMYLQMSLKSARAKLLLQTVARTSAQILVRLTCKLRDLRFKAVSDKVNNDYCELLKCFKDFFLSCMHMRIWLRWQQRCRKR